MAWEKFLVALPGRVALALAASFAANEAKGKARLSAWVANRDRKGRRLGKKRKDSEGKSSMENFNEYGNCAEGGRNEVLK